MRLGLLLLFLLTTSFVLVRAACSNSSNISNDTSLFVFGGQQNSWNWNLRVSRVGGPTKA